jgi:choice-of-anchor B domain-containing protein
MDLLGTWKDTNIVKNNNGNRHNDIWGYAQNGREYAIIGSTIGTHIIDVTNPSSPVEVDFLLGKHIGNVVHRDFKVYQNYVYMVCDQGPSSLQIADLSFLPDSVHLVYDEDSLIVKSHNIFIDTANARLYSCGGTKKTGGNDLSVFDITNPVNPVLLMDFKDSFPFWGAAVGYVHDIYVKDNIGYTHDDNAMHIIDFNDVNAPVILGDLSSYIDQGYNHSGWLSDDDTTYVLLDETPGKRVKFLDVSDPSDIRVTDVEGCDNCDTSSLPHNSFFIDKLAYTSYYDKGLYIFDATDRTDVKTAGFYSDNISTSGYWGVYPFLPSGNIIVSDMVLGLIVLKLNYVTGLPETPKEAIKLYPNPIKSGERVSFSKRINYEVYSISGQSLLGKQQGTSFSTAQMPTGCYFIKINNTFTKLIVK